MISKINNFVSGFVGGLMGNAPKKTAVKKAPTVKCTHKKKCKCN